jgi:hypothetical protein
LRLQSITGPYAEWFVSCFWLDSFPYWLWRRVIPYTWYLRRGQNECNRSSEYAYSYATPDPTSGISSGPCKPDFQCGLFHVPNLDTDFDCGFFLFTWLYSMTFDCGLFRLPNLDTLNLTAYVWIWNKAHGRFNRLEGDQVQSSAEPDPTFAFVGGLCCPTFPLRQVFFTYHWISIPHIKLKFVS